MRKDLTDRHTDSYIRIYNIRRDLLFIIIHREETRRLEEERLKRRQAALRARNNPSLTTRLQRRLQRYLPPGVSRRALLATATVLLGVYVYYRPDLLFNR